VDWRSFSVGSGNTVRIENGSGATLNRVTGDAPSTIAGTVSATGSVYLVNPQGIVVTPQGRIVTGGSFVATTRPVDAARFMESGQLGMSGTSDGTVENQGRIEAGQDVVLVGRSVVNTGAVRAQGSAAMVAADDVVLQREGDRTRVMVRGGAGGDVRNTGTIEAAEVALRAVGGNVYALAGNAGSYIRATGTTTRNGRVLLAGDDEVQVQGNVSADGATGGSVTVRAGNRARVAGSVSARGSVGDGGRVVISADNVEVASGARIDASGAARGGTVLLGGDRAGGRDPAQRLSTRPVQNATRTEVAAGASIVADGAANAGGNIVVWSEQETRFDGQLSARGWIAGGFAEVSSLGLLRFAGSADLRGATGRNGTLLLDPADIYITEASAPAGASKLSANLVGSLLTTSNVTVQTGGGSGNGDIFVQAPITWSSNHSLVLSAARHVIVNAPIQATGSGALTLQADNTGTGTGTVSFGQDGAARLNGGNATILYNASSFASPTNYGPFVTGSGSLDALMLVTRNTQMGEINTNTQGTYALGRDLDWNGGAFGPLAAFSGLFDGRGHTLAGISINAPGENDVGIWRQLLPSARIRNLNVTNAIVNAERQGGYFGSGGTRIGILAGTNEGDISNSRIAGQVSGAAEVGGVIGRNAGTLLSVASSAAVTARSNYIFWNIGGSAGGIAGVNTGSITNSSSSGGVSGNPTGSIAGVNNGSIASGVNTGPRPASWSNLPGDVSAWTLSGTARDVSGTSLPLAMIGTLTSDGLIASPAGTDGSWTQTVPVPVLRPGAVLVALLGGAAPGTLQLAGVSNSLQGLSLQSGTARIVMATGQDTAVSSLLAARGGLLNGSMLAEFMPLSAAGPFNGTLDITVPGVLALDSGLTINGRLALNAASVTQSAPLSATALALQGAGRFSLANPGNSFATVAGTVGSADLLTTSGLTIGTAGGITGFSASGELRLTAGGAVTQSAALSAAALALQGPGRFSLTNPSNSFATVAGLVGSADLVTTSALTIGTAGGLSGLISGADTRIRVGGELSLRASLSGQGSGDALVLNAARLTDYTPGGLSVNGGGRWLVYLPDIGTVTMSGLFARPYYGLGFGELVPAAGNRFVYSTPRELSVIPETVATTYDGTVPQAGVLISGFVNGDTLAAAVSGSAVVSGAGRSAGAYTLASELGSLTSDFGYKFAFGSSNLTVARRPLTWSVADVTVPYGTAANPGTVTLGGAVAGDRVGALVSIAREGTGEPATSRPASGRYAQTASALEGPEAGNYVLASSGNKTGLLTVMPPPALPLPQPVVATQTAVAPAATSTTTPAAAAAPAEPASSATSTPAVSSAAPSSASEGSARASSSTAEATTTRAAAAPSSSPAPQAPASRPSTPATSSAAVAATASAAAASGGSPPPPASQPSTPAPSSAAAAPTAGATSAAATGAAAPSPVTTAGSGAPAAAAAQTLAVLAPPGNVTTQARAQFSARANEVLARGGSPAVAAAAAAAALRQMNAASVPPSAAATVAQVATGQGAGALAYALSRGVSADQALAQEAARAATLSTMRAESVVPISDAARTVGSFAQSGGASGPANATLAALLASGRDPERAAASAARAAAAREEMLRATSVPASPAQARATGIARGNTAGATLNLAAALARGASPAAAAARAASAEAERAAAREASTVAIANPQLAALAQRVVDGSSVTVTRRGQPQTLRPQGDLPAQAAEQPSRASEVSTAFATGRLPASFLTGLPASVQADRQMALQLRRGVPLQQIMADSPQSTAGVASQVERAQVPAVEFVSRIGAGNLSGDYLLTLASGSASDNVLGRLGTQLHRGASPAEALQRAQERAAGPKL
jgi:filamentous hemagglutinin family protein